MDRYMEYLIQGAQIRVEQFLRRQVRNPGSEIYGGMDSDIRECKETIYVMTTSLACYFHPKSRYYHDEQLREAIALGIGFVARMQREEGYLDFPSCNFYSAADTSFCFKRLYAGYRLMEMFDTEHAMEEIKEAYLAVMHRALDGITAGGFHTPNHRWGICCALLQGSVLFPEDACRYRERAGLYLQEGIDGNEDGEYAEHSTGNYNAVVNNAMMGMYEVTGEEQYLGYMLRNLRMMQYFVNPDGTVFTENSTRQDRGKKAWLDKYFYQYLFAAKVTGDKALDGAAHKIIGDCMLRGEMAPDCLHIVMYAGLENYHFQECGFLEKYRKEFRDTGVVRVRNQHYSYTLMPGNAEFLYFQTEDLKVSLRVGESYCEVRSFIPQQCSRTKEGYQLSAAADGWYYEPFAEKPETSDWWKMDHSARTKYIPSHLKTVIDIEEQERGLSFRLRTEGVDRLPLRVELCVPAGARLENEYFCMDTCAGGNMIIRGGMVKLTQGVTAVVMGPGFGEHTFKGHYSNEWKNEQGFSVFFNSFTPVDREFSITVASELDSMY